MSYFITFEGVEGCGKTTQIRLLDAELRSSGYQVVTTREPGGCPIADKIRSILLDADNSSMAPLAELLLYASARAQHVAEVIKPALEAGAIVLCDRFTDATIAYQNAGRGLDRSQVELLNTLACQAVTPDMTILIDCDPQVGLQRARARIENCAGPREERFELESLQFHQRVRESYLAQAQAEPQRFFKVDGTSSIEEMSAIIAGIVRQRTKRHAVL